MNLWFYFVGFAALKFIKVSQSRRWRVSLSTSRTRKISQTQREHTSLASSSTTHVLNNKEENAFECGQQSAFIELLVFAIIFFALFAVGPFTMQSVLFERCKIFAIFLKLVFSRLHKIRYIYILWLESVCHLSAHALVRHSDKWPDAPSLLSLNRASNGINK